MDVNEYYKKGKNFLRGLLEKKEEEVPPPPSEKKGGISFGDDLIKQGVLGGEDVNINLARQFGLPIFSDISTMILSRDIYQRIPYAFAKRHTILPIAKEGETFLVAVSDPLNLGPLEDIRIMLESDVKAVYSPKDEILSAINNCYNRELGAASQLLEEISPAEEREGESIEVYDLLDDSKTQAPIIKLLNLILTEAIQQGASDIHFEPTEDNLHVRYRIDGVLHNRHTPAAEYQSQLLTRIKVMAKMDIAERRLPQDGRIKLKMGKREIDFRVSTVPIVNGERIVLRILDKGSVVLGLDSLGMPEGMYEKFKELIQLPEGIVLVTGPTGSGKTTTLYSAICDLRSDEINIMTIEDPVEYNLKRIAQIGVRPQINLTFAAGLRHILRQDPDVVMIGEIRDVETAEIAIQAALTGHLVLSTLHTNDSPSAIARLVDMGVEPYLLSSTVIGVQAQRLVRRICEHCKESYKPTDEELKSLSLDKKMLKGGVLYRGKGCEACYEYGYQGRHGVYELLPVSHSVQQQIVKSPDAVELRKIGLEQGMWTLRGHGQQLVINGITTVEEVLRVIRGVD